MFVYALSSFLILFSATSHGDISKKKLTRYHRSVEANLIKQAFQNLRLRKSEAAEEIAEKLSKSKLYLDYYYFISGSASKQIADKKYKENKFSLAEKSINEARKLLSKVSIAEPNSSLLKKTDLLLSSTDFFLADLGYKNKKYEDVILHIQNALTRYNKYKSLSLTPRYVLEIYGKSCKKKRMLLCKPWASRLAEIFPSKSKEYRLISKYFSHLNSPSYSANRKMIEYIAPEPDKTLLKEALGYIMENAPYKAVDAFIDFFKNYPKSGLRTKARYWYGRTLSAIEEKQKANEQFEIAAKGEIFDFYAIAAGFELGRHLSTEVKKTTPSFSEDPSYLDISEIKFLKRAQSFLAAGLNEFAATELNSIDSLESLPSKNLIYFALLNHYAENHRTGFGYITELIRRDDPSIKTPFGLTTIFPMTYFSLVKQHAKENDLDPVLVQSIVKQESAFDSTAISYAGATGLMQLMRFTALDMDRNLEIRSLPNKNKNIQLGTKYFKQVLGRFSNNIALTLAGYNAGPTRAKGWYREWGANDLPTFIEKIPYEETKYYIAKIFRNYYWYQYIVNEKKLTNFEDFWIQKSTVFRKPATKSKVRVEFKPRI